MANQKKFNNPVIIPLRIEKEAKEYIANKYGNITEFINKLINEKIKEEQAK